MTNISIYQIWKENLPNVEILTEKLSHQYSLNITEYKELAIQSVLKPKNFSEIKAIVNCANQFKLPIAPISSGKNWGQGSKLPIQPNHSIVELSSMKKIRVIDEQIRYIIIEPGVTQKELSDALLGTAFMIPMTGSGEDTSIVGNLLERGATSFYHRNDLVLGWEVILGNGETLRTGFWHFVGDKPLGGLFHPAGVGPDLNGLFTQSNFGIVTAVALRLLPKQDGTIVLLETEESKISDIITAINGLIDENIVENWSFLTNKNDPRTTRNRQYTYTGNWISAVIIKGPNEIRKIAFNCVKNRLENLCHQVFGLDSTTPDEYLPDEYFKIIKKLWHGIPSNYSLQSLYGMNNTIFDKDRSNIDQDKEIFGFSAVLPCVPFEGESIVKVLEIAKDVSEKWKVQGFYNFTFLEENVFEGYFRVYFDRSDAEQICIAHQWNEDLNKALEKIGIFPYRLNNLMMPYFFNRPTDVFSQTIALLKDSLDPNGVINLGKYSPIF